MITEIKTLLANNGYKVVEFDRLLNNACSVREIKGSITPLTSNRYRIFHQFQIIYKTSKTNLKDITINIAKLIYSNFDEIENIEYSIDDENNISVIEFVIPETI
ncbi:hypothetical protein SAMN02745164_00513 [Marinitoga hydrogenitolerans DSM 16785]|uniref:Uncharacterized protein n=1 Tax=Marinitoga hydrogenitolerans (strain DSM 16785 / JCM 12826 / AT1271) TaxID=1122195 RepID=A0A1M4TUW3_MARH1|nr:hypothetical protein [Marinitoga hydrogenitolerans]SHE48097.1 hypothetical protein SAMN02745164_00513 [Marinitoga hydrogenitolerans DSM 16785]